MDISLRIESRALKYGYSNARVKVMKGLLLKQATLEDMIKVGSIEAMVEILQRTNYRNDLTNASVNYSGSDLIEMAASANFAHVVQKLLTVVPHDDKPLLEALLVKWDLLNLKTMMHAKMLGKGYDDIKHQLFSIGGLSKEDFKRIMKSEEREILREIKRTKLGEKMLSTSTEHFSRGMWETFKNALRNLDTFTQTETIIDAYSYMLMDKALSETGGQVASFIRDLLKREIDAKNVMIIERLKKHGADKLRIRKTLIKGGTITDHVIDKIIEAKDLPTVISLIKPKFRQLEFKEGEPGLVDLEIALEKSIAAQKLLAFHRSILSVGVLIGFLLLKEEEMSNLRKIAKAKEFKIPEEEVRKMLVVV
ncbi:V-type ATPase subunit [Candidatus Micrarchaeota archaeon]|nr:V-type ATPase subunit [Candidatus Micrarchaeota archaeon]